MAKTFDQSLDDIARLVKHYQTHRAAFHAPGYKEAHARQNLIDPLFIALDWDVYNTGRAAPQYQPVVLEDSLEVEGGKKAPDYAFRIGRDPAFFAEAKKPAESIKANPDHAYQLRRYAWSAKLPLSLLTDFEELAVYDCRAKPSDKDKASVGRIHYFTFEEYADRWRDLWDVFSYDAVRSGSFDAYAQSAKGKRGTSEVDAEFLKQIEHWRDVLARNIALRNPRLSIDELNDAVQRTIDRLIFLRMAEDRGIEPYGRLLQTSEVSTPYPALRGRSAETSEVYAHLIDLCRAADAKYNAGLFDFSPTGDALAPKLKVDDSVLKPILSSLYYPQSPYEFSVLPAEILGSVYEQFLGKVIRLTAAHHAKVEEKPEVKKAGGVYYTPAYIVAYIVKNTVGKLVEGKSPKQLAGFRVLDMACGSGSFLLGAYQYLLDHYLKWYADHDPEKHAKAVWQPPLPSSPHSGGDKGAEWHLTTAEKKRILTAHIFGVDIDRQAVEVTKLSLLLKVLEGESDETLGRQLALFPERALPNLNANIKCGNSLIGPDYFSEQLMPDTEELKRVNPFDWEREFPEVFNRQDAKNAKGGFDCVIGNPPYVDIKALPITDVRYIFATYPSANNRINLFAAFIEKSLTLVQPSSFRVSMIVPTALLTQESYKALRGKVVDNWWITKIVRLPNESFGAAAGDVKVDTVIVAFGEQEAEEKSTEVIGYAGYARISKIDPSTAQVHDHVHQEVWAKSEDCVWAIGHAEMDEAILLKCEDGSVPLDECTDFSLGLTPYDKYKGHTPDQIEKQVFHADRQKNKTFKRLLAGNDVMRYFIKWNGKHWISYGPWLGAPREPRFFTQKRILVKQIIDWTTKRIWASITGEELYNTQNAFNLLARPGWTLEYLLGILNSRLMTFYHRKKYLDEFKMRFQKILIKDCRRFPIRPIDFSNPADKARHDRMVTLVEQMLELHQRLAVASAAGREVLQRQVDATDRRIDQVVYELYGLTEDEIRIVEVGAR